MSSNMPRILIVDDDEQIRELLYAVFDGAGYEVATAADGGQGLKSFRKRSADLLIVDIFMPVKEGLETLLELKRGKPTLKSIAISGGGLTGEMEFLQHAQTFGADRAFAKPLDLKALLSAVRELLGPTDGAPEECSAEEISTAIDGAA